MDKVLIVDDQSNVTGTLKGLLEYEGFEVEIANNVQSGKIAFLRLIPDVLVVDWDLQQQHHRGTDLIEWARKQNPKVICIILDVEKDRLTALSEIFCARGILKQEGYHLVLLQTIDLLPI